jgi:hypothetical protein
MLLERLAGHPEALKAVIEGLHELEHKAAPEGLAVPLRGPLAAIEHEARP